MDGTTSLFATDTLPVADAIRPSRARTRAPRRNQRHQKPAGQWPLDGAINVVLFAGMGGACQGLEEAGLPIHVACNHDEVAISAHKALNPHTSHVTGDLFDVDPLKATEGRRVKVLWASPDCKDHSSAKGGAPRSPRVRSLPWQVCRWAAKTRPDVIAMENVREIRGWGPLVAKRDKVTGRVIKLDGTVAAPGERVPVWEQQLIRDTKRLGKTFRRWRRHLESLGYAYEDRDLCCADFGVPTSRRRWFAVARRDGLPIRWPERTHGPRDSAEVKAGKLKPYRAAAEIIDWSKRLPSIFDRKKDLAAATQKRIAVGMKRFVLDAEKPFLIHTTHHGSRPEIDPEEPMPTITGAHRGEMAVVGATMAATIVGAGGRAAQVPPMDVVDPLNTSTTKEDRLVVAASLVGVAHGDDAKSGSRTYDIEDALRTATGSNDQAVVGAYLTRYHGERRPGEARGIDPADPLATQTTENRFGFVGATIAPAIMSNNANNIGAAADDAVPTVTTGNRNFVVGAFLEEAHGNSTGRDAAGPMPTQTQVPHHSVIGAALVSTANTGTTGRGSYAWPPEEPVRTVTTTGSHAVIGAAMVQTGYGEREGQAPRALDVGEPIGTQVTNGGKHAVMGAWMVQHNTGVIGHEMPDALSTMTTLGTQQQVAAAYMTEFRGTSADGQPVTDPAGSMCTGGGRGGSHDGVTAAFLSEYYGTGGQHQDCGDALNTLTTNDRFAVTGAAGVVPPLPPEKLARAREVAAFLRRHGVWDDREFVTLVIDGITWIVIDIGMRMLTPAEAAAAHELRMPDLITVYKRDRKGNIVIGPDEKPEMVTRPLTKTEAMRLVGNSVPKRMAKLLAEANAVHALTIPSIAAE